MHFFLPRQIWQQPATKNEEQYNKQQETTTKFKPKNVTEISKLEGGWGKGCSASPRHAAPAAPITTTRKTTTATTATRRRKNDLKPTQGKSDSSLSLFDMLNSQQSQKANGSQRANISQKRLAKAKKPMEANEPTEAKSEHKPKNQQRPEKQEEFKKKHPLFEWRKPA